MLGIGMTAGWEREWLRKNRGRGGEQDGGQNGPVGWVCGGVRPSLQVSEEDKGGDS